MKDINSETLLENQVLQNLIKEELFHLMLQKSLIADKFLEKFLTKIRCELLFTFDKLNIKKLKEYFNFKLTISSEKLTHHSIEKFDVLILHQDCLQDKVIASFLENIDKIPTLNQNQIDKSLVLFFLINSVDKNENDFFDTEPDFHPSELVGFQKNFEYRFLEKIFKKLRNIKEVEQTNIYKKYLKFLNNGSSLCKLRK